MNLPLASEGCHPLLNSNSICSKPWVFLVSVVSTAQLKKCQSMSSYAWIDFSRQAPIEVLQPLGLVLPQSRDFIVNCEGGIQLLYRRETKLAKKDKTLLDATKRVWVLILHHFPCHVSHSLLSTWSQCGIWCSLHTYLQTLLESYSCVKWRHLWQECFRLLSNQALTYCNQSGVSCGKAWLHFLSYFHCLNTR